MSSARFSIQTYPLILLIALCLRIALIPNPGFEADISFWKSWGLATLDMGVIKGLPLTNFNYPTPFAYMLGFMVWLYDLFADPHTFNEFWQNTNLLFLTIAKAFPIAADFGIATLIVYLGKHAKRLGLPVVSFSWGGLTFYTLLASIYLLSPLSLMDGALWGQIDSVGVFLFLLAVTTLLQRMPFLSGVIFTIAMMTKLQNMIYGPVFFLFSWQLLGFAGFRHALMGAVFAFVGLNIEFILAHQSWRILASITGNYDYFPLLSLNAYNPWWIASGGHGTEFSDKIMAIGITNAKTVGLVVFSGFYLFAVLQQLKEKRSILMSFLTSLVLVNASFFLFQTQSHERYAFPLAAFLLLWSPFVYANIRAFFLWYGVFTVIYFYNLHTALILNYPNNGIHLLNGLNTPTLTITASVVLTCLFFLFVFVRIRNARALGKLLLLCVGVCICLLTVTNLPLLTKSPVPLGKITPMASSAGYGSRQINMPAVSSFGIDKWSPLSVQYAFYKTGIGTHAPAKDIYAINGKFTKLVTDYGIDTNGGPQGSVVFEVYGDGKRLFQSEVIKRFDLPRHTEVDIQGVKKLELIVTDGGNGNIDDHADWLNTYLIP